MAQGELYPRVVRNRWARYVRPEDRVGELRGLLTRSVHCVTVEFLSDADADAFERTVKRVLSGELVLVEKSTLTAVERGGVGDGVAGD